MNNIPCITQSFGTGLMYSRPVRIGNNRNILIYFLSKSDKNITRVMRRNLLRYDAKLYNTTKNQNFYVIRMSYDNDKSSD